MCCRPPGRRRKGRLTVTGQRKDLPPGFKNVTCPCGCKVDLTHSSVVKGTRRGVCPGCNTLYVSKVEGKKGE